MDETTGANETTEKQRPSSMAMRRLEIEMAGKSKKLGGIDAGRFRTRRAGVARRWMRRYLGDPGIAPARQIDDMVRNGGIGIADACMVELRFRGRTYREIGALFGVTAATASRRLSRFEDLLAFRVAQHQIQASQSMPEVVEAVVAIARDDEAENRDRISAFKELREMVMPRKAGQTNIATNGGVIQHGEQNLTVSDARRIEGMDGDGVAKRLRQIEREWKRPEAPE